MSEYQYYEFQALDRPLTREEQGILRGYSTRARITSNSFVNEYHYGDFKGDADEWMARYFDAFLYVANWGTRILKIRIPEHLYDGLQGDTSCESEILSAQASDGNVVLTFELNEIEGSDWMEAEEWLSSLTPIRDELIEGDRRSLYLGWLLGIEFGAPEDDDIEPSVPAGLRALTEAQSAWVEFFDLDRDLIMAAAEASPALPAKQITPDQVDSWVAQLPPAERDDLLVRLIRGKEPKLQGDLYRRASQSAPKPLNVPGKRTVKELLERAEQIRTTRKAAEAKRLAEEKAQKEREAAIARSKYLDSLSGKEPTLWEKVEDLVATKQPKRYDEAVALLKDLRDLAERSGSEEFEIRLQGFRVSHAQKPSFMQRMDRAELF